MSMELNAKTEPGQRLVALAETLAADFATRATDHDREASYPFASIDALRAVGYFAAPIPTQYGGMASHRCTTCWSPPAGSPAATPRSRSG